MDTGPCTLSRCCFSEATSRFLNFKSYHSGLLIRGSGLCACVYTRVCKRAKAPSVIQGRCVQRWGAADPRCSRACPMLASLRGRRGSTPKISGLSRTLFIEECLSGTEGKDPALRSQVTLEGGGSSPIACTPGPHTLLLASLLPFPLPWSTYRRLLNPLTLGK